MDNQSSVTALRCFDLLQVQSGEILTVCGNYDGSWLRTRLSFYPSTRTTRLIAGRLYQKVAYEQGYAIPECEKVLDLPGEQHFIVNRGQIVQVYRAVDAFDILPEKIHQQCRHFVEFLFESCKFDPKAHGLTGSSALGCLQHGSDIDWILYTQDPSAVIRCIRNSNECKPARTFTMEHVYRKYGVFTSLTRKDLDKLFGNRWKYINFQGLPISVSIVDPNVRSDNFLKPYIINEVVSMEGEIISTTGAYQMPQIIPVVSGGVNYTLLTWQFLYNGAFSQGDRVAFSGRACTVHKKPYILIEQTDDYIRKSYV